MDKKTVIAMRQQGTQVSHLRQPQVRHSRIHSKPQVRHLRTNRKQNYPHP